MKKILIALPLLAAIVAGWVVYGRFAVEGGKGPWAMINDRTDVLKQALADGMSDKEKQTAYRRALGRHNVEGVRLLLAAGIKPSCDLAHAAWFGGVELMQMFIDAGDNASKCPDAGAGLASDIILRGAPLAEDDLIALLQLATKGGVPLGPAAIKTAEAQKLPKLIAYLKNPSAPVDLKAQPLALLGEQPGLDGDALKPVCEGEGVAALPPYKLVPGKISPVYVFELVDDKPRAVGAVLPRWWTSTYQLGHTQVVACARVVSKNVVKTCKFEHGVTVNYYDATFDLSVREGHTAKQLASKTVSLEVERVASCPLFKMGATNEAVYPKYGAELGALVKPILGVE